MDIEYFRPHLRGCQQIIIVEKNRYGHNFCENVVEISQFTAQETRAIYLLECQSLDDHVS